jgi:hypothetical protein
MRHTDQPRFAADFQLASTEPSKRLSCDLFVENEPQDGARIDLAQYATVLKVGDHDAPELARCGVESVSGRLHASPFSDWWFGKSLGSDCKGASAVGA